MANPFQPLFSGPQAFVNPQSVQQSHQVVSNVTLYPQHIPTLKPEWQDIARSVLQSVGRVILGTSHLGWATLIGIDRAIIPYHTLQGQCPQNFRISFMWENETTSSLDNYRIIRIFACPAMDFAVIQLSKGQTHNRFPGETVRFSRGVGNIGGELMLVHGDRNAYRVASFGALSLCRDRGGNFCSFNQTVQGSSGGTYFDRYGRIAAMHLSRSTGLCVPNSQERKAILFRDIWNRAFLREVGYLAKIPICQILPPPSTPIKCIPFHATGDVCYANESNKVHHGEVTIGNMKCTYKELRFETCPLIGGHPRGVEIITISEKVVINDRKKSVVWVQTPMNVKFIFLQDPHECNEYNNNHHRLSDRLYYSGASALLEYYIENRRLPDLLPDRNHEQIIFKAYGKKFPAIRNINGNTFVAAREVE